jgi:multicomponent Na+:H+ antiporter subunit D
MVYVMLRLMLTVFTPVYVYEILSVQSLIIWLAVGAILIGAFLALTAKTLKRMLTYIIIAEIGYMVGGAWLGNRAAMTGTILHIFNDILMTFCAFLAASNIIYVLKSHRLEKLQGVFRLMPLTMGGLVLGAMSMIGVPPTCGFFSKWYLLQGGLQSGHIEYVIALIFSSLINVVLFFKVFEIGFFEPMHNGHSQAPSLAIKEAPWSMTLTLILVALGLVATGLYTGNLVTLIIDPAIPASIS